MFFESADEILKIAKKSNTTIFVLPKDVEVKIPGAIILKPEEKTVITIEQVREMISRLSLRQVSEQFIVIRPAEKLGDDAANAFLKNLEEPNEKIHFLLITESLNEILPTILSRAAIYILREKGDKMREVKADEKIKTLAKKLMAAKAEDLVKIAEEITKKKDGVREYALEIVGVAIEMIYKTYFLTKKENFLIKLPKFLELYEKIEKNGHVKLQIVACLC